MRKVKVFDYTDYREFLKDFYQERKEHNYFWSYRFMGERLGLDHSFIVKVLAGQRHIKESHLPRVVQLCKLSDREEEYFRNLYFFNKAKSDAQVKLYFEKMMALKSVDSLSLEENQYRYFQKWYYAAVRSAVEYLDFRDDYKMLAKHISPGISVKEAREAVSLLKNLGFIQQNEDGRWELVQRHLQTPDKWKSIAIRNFQESCLQLAEKSMDLHPKEERDYSTITMAIESDKLSFLKNLLHECRTSVVQQVEEMDNPDRVYQLNMQLFPLTKPQEEDK